jgi:uncharacterized membrane protein
VWIRARLFAIGEDVRASYWFIPSLLALAGFAGGLALVVLDVTIGDKWLGQFEWFYGSRPAGARALLSTVAGSTITVAGVVFSITLAAVTYASGQYGPRLLSNFMRDRGNQATLGVFIGTFLYCLVVLRTIRSAEETSADTAGAIRESFVPHVAMFGALALAVLSIAVLIYFVHHVTDGIHINNVIARIGQQLIDDVAKLSGPANQESCSTTTMPPGSVATTLVASKTGYIQAIDEKALLAIAVRRCALLKLLVKPGDFTHKGRPLLSVSRGAELDECHDLFSIGRKRSGQQDLRFAIDELVEIAARALSPGVNDPFTAIACIDWLGAALSDLAAKGQHPELLRDHEGRPRLVVPRLDFEDYLGLAVGQLRTYVAADPNAASHLDRMLRTVWLSIDDLACRAMVEAEQARLRAEVSRMKGC